MIRKLVKKEKRKIIWLNTLFVNSVNINIGKYFLKLIDKLFNKIIYYII